MPSLENSLMFVLGMLGLYLLLVGVVVYGLFAWNLVREWLRPGPTRGAWGAAPTVHRANSGEGRHRVA